MYSSTPRKSPTLPSDHPRFLVRLTLHHHPISSAAATAGAAAIPSPDHNPSVLPFLFSRGVYGGCAGGVCAVAARHGARREWEQSQRCGAGPALRAGQLPHAERRPEYAQLCDAGQCYTQPCTIHHAPCTTHHSPCTMHHTPCTIHHAPYTMHHAPCTIHHTIPPPTYPHAHHSTLPCRISRRCPSPCR
jgi:hypothetical protein